MNARDTEIQHPVLKYRSHNPRPEDFKEQKREKDAEKKQKLTKPKTQRAGFLRRGVVDHAQSLTLKWVCTKMEKALSMEMGSGAEALRYVNGGDSGFLGA